MHEEMHTTTRQPSVYRVASCVVPSSMAQDPSCVQPQPQTRQHCSLQAEASAQHPCFAAGKANTFTVTAGVTRQVQHTCTSGWCVRCRLLPLKPSKTCPQGWGIMDRHTRNACKQSMRHATVKNRAGVPLHQHDTGWVAPAGASARNCWQGICHVTLPKICDGCTWHNCNSSISDTTHNIWDREKS
jgi:hypothetical protein